MLSELVRTGRWRTQFETGTSGGGLTAVAGGDRWRWESRLFEGRYDEADAAERPVHGALRIKATSRGTGTSKRTCTAAEPPVSGGSAAPA